MGSTLLESPITSACKAATSNFFANRAVLSTTQSQFGADLTMPLDDVEWIFARDGTLTALEPEDTKQAGEASDRRESGLSRLLTSRRWWAGCSLPLRAAEFMLRKAELPGTVIC